MTATLALPQRRLLPQHGRILEHGSLIFIYEYITDSFMTTINTVFLNQKTNQKNGASFHGTPSNRARVHERASPQIGIVSPGFPLLQRSLVSTCVWLEHSEHNCHWWSLSPNLVNRAAGIHMEASTQTQSTGGGTRCSHWGEERPCVDTHNTCFETLCADCTEQCMTLCLPHTE
jgi:hypothetical protein